MSRGQQACHPDIQQRCPRGYRFLVQWIGPWSLQQARQQVADCFGREDAVLVRGVYRASKAWDATPWTFDADGGWVAYVPRD